MTANIKISDNFTEVNGVNEKSDVTIHTSDTLLCGICNINADNIVEFLKHKLQHQGPRGCFVCQLCQISYTKEISLRKHYKHKHRIQLYPRKVNKNHNQTENNEISSVEDCEDKGDNFINIKMENVDTGSLDLFDHNSPDTLNNSFDHDYEKSSSEIILMNQSKESIVKNNIVDLKNDIEISPAIIINPGDENSAIDMGYLEIKPTDELPLCYTNTLVVTNNEGPLPMDNMVEENGLVTCNVEIISLDQPIELPITDQEKQDGSGNDEMYSETEDEYDFYFCIKSDVNAGKSFSYSREDLMCIYCNFKDMVLANLFQHMCDNHQDHLNVREKIQLQENTKNVKVMKFSKYKEICCRNKMENGRKNRNTEKQDQAGEFPCSKCEKVFTRLRYLKKHDLLHKSEKPFLCDFCGKSFKTRTYLNVHHRSHSKKTFKCDQCDFSSSNTALIRLHRQEHNSGCVLCDVCGNAYSDKSTLTKHKRVHDPSRPYQCNYPGCTWRFLTEVMCRAHQRNHDSEGKFICTHCGYAFRHKHHVKRHEARVHGIKNPNDKSANKTKSAEEMPAVNVVVESTEENSCIQESVTGGQLVITTDSEGNAFNYHIAAISNVPLLGSEDSRTIIIPQIDYSNVVLQRVESSEDSPFMKVTE